VIERNGRNTRPASSQATHSDATATIASAMPPPMMIATKSRENWLERTAPVTDCIDVARKPNASTIVIASTAAPDTDSTSA
jgi:hypothetical protein